MVMLVLSCTISFAEAVVFQEPKDAWQDHMRRLIRQGQVVSKVDTAEVQQVKAQLVEQWKAVLAAVVGTCNTVSQLYVDTPFAIYWYSVVIYFVSTVN